MAFDLEMHSAIFSGSASNGCIMRYMEQMVWIKYDETTLVRFTCLKDIESETYAVQSTDYFREPITEQQFASFGRQFLELFMEESPGSRCSWFPTLSEAIEDHQKQFEI